MTTAARSNVTIHPTAIVDPAATLGDAVHIGPFCIIGPLVRLGDGTRLHNNVTITNRVTVGKQNDIHPHAVLGGMPQDLKYRGEDTQVVIGDNNGIREFVTINIGTLGGGGVTRIGNNNLLMAGSHIAHDCELGDHIVLANNTLVAGHVKIEDNVGMSANVGIHHFVTVGQNSFIGFYAGANVDIPPFMLAAGYPTKIVSINSVGLRRRGFSDDRIAALKDAHRLLWRTDLPKPEAYALLEQRYPNQQDVRTLLAFMRASDRGKVGRAREAIRGASSPDPDEDASANGAAESR